ncbi:MAG TPA: hypothetical protein DCS07_12480 [Bdellovibrionales bacterium]|nr:hypothetical protein [Bdellovibrionales bacterium]
MASKPQNAFTSAKGRISILMARCLLGSAALLGRAGWIQLVSNPRLEQMAKRQFQSKVLIRPRRGAILDQTGEPLAINAEINSLAANPMKVASKKTLARLLAKATDVPYSKILQRLNEKKEFVWLKRHMPDRENEGLKRWQIINHEGDLPAGLWLVKESKRVYPHRELAAHVLGDVNIDQEGLEGVELAMNEPLRGRVVSVAAIKDALGRPTFIDAVAAKDVQDGENVSLTIDASLQFNVEEQLRNSVQKANARSGSVLVMNAENGEILAMANEPSFNPNEKSAPAERRRNRLATDGYEPGSTLKAVLLASALSHGFKLSDQIYAERGSFSVQGKKISEAEAHEKFEWISLRKMIKVSSNVGAAKLALKLGADHYASTLHALGFGTRTQFGFPGEISGRIPARKSWQPLTLANIGFGQGLLATRMQMARAYAAFLNGGWLVQPTLFKIPADKTKLVPPKRIFTQKVADQVLEALEGVTQAEGTGINAALAGYRVAGKTGTAQMVDPGSGRYSRSKFIASFIGFPLGVEPKVVILTTIEEPHGIYYASETAAPLFREVLNAVVTRYSIPSALPLLTQSDGQTKRQKSEVLRQTANVESTIDRIKNSQAKSLEALPNVPSSGNLQWSGMTSEGIPIWTMPSLIGLTVREATRALQGHRFQLELHGAGIIQSQSPMEGQRVSDSQTIRLTLLEPQ